MADIIVSGASPMLMPREDPVGKIVFAVVVIAIGLACFVSLMTLLAAVMGKTTGRSRDAIESMPLRALLAGIAGYTVLLGAGAWLYSRAVIERLLETEVIPGMYAAATLVTAIPILASLLGAPGTFVYIGDRLAALHGGEVSGLRRLALGTLLSALASMFPLVGWFVVMPTLLAMAFGAFLIGTVRARFSPYYG